MVVVTLTDSTLLLYLRSSFGSGEDIIMAEVGNRLTPRRVHRHQENLREVNIERERERKRESERESMLEVRELVLCIFKLRESERICIK